MPEKSSYAPIVQFSTILALFMAVENWINSDRWTKTNHIEYSKTIQSEIDGLQRQVDDLKKLKCKHETE